MSTGSNVVFGRGGEVSIGREDTDSSVLSLIDKASKMGLTNDIRDFIDGVDTLKEILNKKNAELDLLEVLAMQSDDENITELREQLFATVKLIHSDVIQEMISHRDVNVISIDESESFWNIGSDRKEQRNKRSLLDKVRGAWNAHQKIKKLHKISKQRIKESLKKRVSGEDTPMQSEGTGYN